MNLFSQTQILTKFFKLESNYANNFFQYHSAIGINKFIVIAQTDEDVRLLNNFRDYNIKILAFPSNITPQQCVQSINFKHHSFYKAKYTILLDFDEFIEVPSNADLECIQNMIDVNGSISLRWLMRISLEAQDPEPYGFLGHIGKQWALTNHVRKPLSDHLLIKPNIYEHHITHLRLVHAWSRSLNDLIAKSLFSRYISIKTKDQDRIVELLEQNKLPNRLKLLAYMSIIPKRLMISDSLQKANTYFESDTIEFINNQIGDENSRSIKNLFVKYKSKLAQDIFDFNQMKPHTGFSYEHFHVDNKLEYCNNILPFYPNHNKSQPSLRQIINFLPDFDLDSLN